MAIAAVATLCLALWVFYEMADDAPKGQFIKWDEPVLRLVRGGPDAPQGAPAVATIARVVTGLGGAPLLTVISVLAVAWSCRRHQWRAALIIAMVAIGAPLLTKVLKQSFARQRPDVISHLVKEDSLSFPSGHALSSSAIYITLSVLMARRAARRSTRIALVASGFLLSFMIGLSRLYLGVHYPTDVLAGWSAGTAWAIIWLSALVCWEHSARGGHAPSARVI